MRRSTFAAALATLIALSGHPAKAGHFVDSSGTEIASLEPLHGALVRHFGEATPKSILVLNRPGSPGSRFDPDTATVFIAPPTDSPPYRAIVGHESAHLAMAALTDGASVQDKFRFFDEGFACVFENEIANRSGAHRITALETARRQLAAGNVSFAKVTDWRQYFGDPGPDGRGRMTDYAYPVGSSFIYFALDTFGRDALFAFFRAIGRTRDLDAALLAAFGSGAGKVEARWLGWLSQQTPPTEPPRILRLHPADGADEVPAYLAEIEVEFDQPMSEDILLSTPCSDGICYTDARWRSDTVLTVAVHLQPGRAYALKVGAKGLGLPNAARTASSAETPWRFRTAPAPTP